MTTRQELLDELSGLEILSATWAQCVVIEDGKICGEAGREERVAGQGAGGGDNAGTEAEAGGLMTDREFWRTVHRHLLGIVAAIVKRWLTENN